jgi:sigma-54 dependent transcriptional regulator, acetoin dehydrogenase operon transcriptional activator AcoR
LRMTYSIIIDAEANNPLRASESIDFSVSILRVLSSSELPVLLLGERGAGKKLLARALHEQSAGRDAPFVTVQCAGRTAESLAYELFGQLSDLGVTPGKIEAAHGGTLYLEDVEHLPREIHQNLRSALATGEVHPVGSPRARPAAFRLVCSSSVDASAEFLEAGRASASAPQVAWRKVLVPPLRTRGRELPLLVEHFAREAARDLDLSPKSFAPDVLEAFAHYDWPGNLHELRDVVREAVRTSAEMVALQDLPLTLASAAVTDPIQSATGELAGLELAEYHAICDSLRSHRGNLTRTARDLRIARSTLYAKLKKYGLEEGLGGLRVRSDGVSTAVAQA